MTQMPGIQSQTVMSGILPYSSNSVGAGTAFPFLGGTGNTAQDALVPGSYYSWQFRPDMWLGMSVNSPFGLSVNFPIGWAGGQYAAGSTYLKTYNATPSFAWRINDMISVGVGVQIQYAKADLSHCVTAPCGVGAPLAELSGKDWGYGFTAGVTVTPTPTTTLGIGYRSGINQKIDGTLSISGIGSSSASTTLNLPDTVSAGLAPEVDVAVDRSGHRRVDELEPDRHFRRGSRTVFDHLAVPVQGWMVVLARRRVRVGSHADACAAVSASRSRRSPTTCAYRCCRTTTATGRRSARPINGRRRRHSTSPIRICS